jgi:hypothetical protein
VVPGFAVPSRSLDSAARGQRCLSPLFLDDVATKAASPNLKPWFGNYPIGWMDEHTLQTTDLNDPPKRLPNSKTQAEQNLSKKEKPKMDSDDPPEPVTEKDK